MWSKIRDLIRSKTKNSCDYDEKFMEIKFDSDDDLPLNKKLEVLSMIIVNRAVFYKDNKYYSQVFLDECLCKFQMLYFHRIDICEETNINKARPLKKRNSNTCH